MRNTTILLVLLLVMAAGFANAASARFYITTSTTNELEQTYMDDFQGTVIKLIKENYSCASIQTASNVAVLLSREKERQLVGVGKENAIENIGESMSCDFLISLNIRIYNDNKASIDAVCLNPKTAKALSRASSVSQEGNVLNTLDKVAQQLIDGLKEYEICPFTGPVTINVHSLKDTTTIEEYGVYCNEADQQFRKETKTNSLTKSDWKLERKDVSWTMGTMTFSSEEFHELKEENGCYKCRSSNREGGRTYTEKKSYKVNGTGLSHLSVRQGTAQPDTRILLKFLSDDTYIVQFKGVSDLITALEKNEEQAVGTCDNKPLVRNETKREISIPLNYFFGPYPGKSTDKVLQKKDSKVVYDPVTHEKSTITIDFTLNQKDK